MDTGNFTFSIDQYKSAGVAITNKMKQDSVYSNELISRFVPNMQRALMTAVETKILSIGPDTQTTADTNTINGAHHRWVAGGTNQVISIDDFAKARMSLRRAQVPMNSLVAIVDPSVEYTLNTLANFTNVSNNPRFEGIVTTGVSSGMRFLMNIYGFDVYTSDYLKVNTADETINSVTAVAGINNLFFSADASATPFVGLIRQQPVVESDYNKDLQQEEHVVTMRYGFGLYRPENMVTILTEDHSFS